MVKIVTICSFSDGRLDLWDDEGNSDNQLSPSDIEDFGTVKSITIPFEYWAGSVLHTNFRITIYLCLLQLS